jgi:exodeoxyribonuclease VII large subunit
MNAPLFADSPTNATEYSVSEISNALKRTVEDAFGNVRVRGEISGYRGPHSSGHAYFCLKDDRARLDAVIWKTSFARLRFRPEEGMEVIATGRLTTFPGKSNYQIVIDTIEPAGAGALMALIEERKRRFAAEGLFDAGRKKPLPFMPRVIGVVTSPTGAVIRDILHRIADRFPLHVLVWPVRVQGETTGAEVAAAVAGFNGLGREGRLQRPDLLIVARGGGSLEDLWGFNDEAVVRAVAASTIPLISAVGHETDWTLIDFVADRRAPTPTGAAEMAVPVRAELEAGVAGQGARLRACLSRGLDSKRQALRGAERALPSPDQLLGLPRRRFDEAASRLGRAFDVMLERKQARYHKARLSPATLGRRLDEARRRLQREGEQLPKCAKAYLRHRRSDWRQTAARLRLEPIERHMSQGSERLAATGRRGERALSIRLLRLRDAVSRSERLLNSLSYRAVLKRGFAVVKDAAARPITSVAAVEAGALLDIEFADGSVAARAEGAPTRRREAAGPAATTGRRSRASSSDQGSLF